VPPLEGYDLVMLGILAVAAVIGFFKGFVWQLAWIVGIVVSGFVAIRFGGLVAPYFGQQPPWNRLVAMLALYAASSVGVGFVFKLISGLIDKVHLSSFDHQLGLVFGAAKGLLMCIVVTFFAVTLAPDYRPQIVGSRSGKIMADLIVRADALLPPDIHELVEPFIRQFEEKLGSPSGTAGVGMGQLASPGNRSAEQSPLAALWQGVTSAAAWSGVEGAPPGGAALPASTDAVRQTAPASGGSSSPARLASGLAEPPTAGASPGGTSLFGRGLPAQGAAGAGGALLQTVAPVAGFAPAAGGSAPSAVPSAVPSLGAPPAVPPFPGASAMAPPGPFPAGTQTPLPQR
jgi:membrane protein required for colicin V production